MRLINALTYSLISTIIFASCQKEKSLDVIPGEENNNSGAAIKQQPEEAEPLSRSKHKRGFVYTLSNQIAGNKVMVYKRSAIGSLTFTASYLSGGNGTGGGLGNQGAVIISDDEDVLLAVNSGSNTISSFKITSKGLILKSTVSSGGTTPVSIAQHDELVYVLNAGGTGNISGFKLVENDKLTPLSSSTRPLSSAMAGAAQVSFVRNGRVLVITEKSTNKIITYAVNESGRPGMMHMITAASPTPFGFAPGRFGNIYVSEAVGGAPNASNVSSYHVSSNGSISLTQGPVPTGQSAACWVVLTENGRHIYTTNTASDNISSYNVHPVTGNISILHSLAATSAGAPIDAALTDNSKYLYILNTAGHTITGYSVSANGALMALPGTITGLPVGANGLAAD